MSGSPAPGLTWHIPFWWDADEATQEQFRQLAASGTNPILTALFQKALPPTDLTEIVEKSRDLYPVPFEARPSVDHARVLAEGVGASNPEANAFAAELLAPSEWLRQHIPAERVIDDEQLVEFASELEAPLGCVKHQIENHGLATIRWTSAS